MISLAFIVTAVKGDTAEGQGGLIKETLNKYIDGVAAVAMEKSAEPAEIAEYIAFPGIWDSQRPNTLTMIQESQLISRETIMANVIGEDELVNRNSVIEYEVQEGDTLSFIAFDFGLNLSTILWANKLADANQIKPGMELKIPPTDGVIHTVKSGETVAGIAQKYQTETEKIVDFNGLPKTGDIQVGAVLVIPDGKMIRTASVAGGSQPRFAYLPKLNNFFIWPATGYNWGRIHGRNGIDVANKCGTPVAAAADGVVTFATDFGWNGGYGKYIKISHANNTETLYAHFNKIIATVGERVSQGQIIALMGTTGRSTGCHVHFEVHGAQNPLVK